MTLMTINESYIRLFAGQDGQAVLSDILTKGKVFSELDGERDIGRQALANEILMLAMPPEEAMDEYGRKWHLLNWHGIKSLINRIRKHK